MTGPETGGATDAVAPFADQPYHPRPQLTRQRWIDLRGPWAFAYDDRDVGLREGWQHRPDMFDRTIIVPFPPESALSGIGDTGRHEVVWYRRTVCLSQAERGDRLLLHFGAVDYRAMVWVNGRLVVRHEGGHTPFSAEITAELTASEDEQVIVVRAEDPMDDLEQPRGKQFWEPEPRDIWYHRTTGIWQAVWLEAVGSTSIAGVRWTPDLDHWVLGLHVTVDHQGEHPLTLRCRLSLRGQVLIDDTYLVKHGELRRGLVLDPAALGIPREQLLWSPSQPNLIDADLTLSDDDSIIDDVHSYAGLRSVGVSGGIFELNGMPTYLRLVLDQGYWPESHLAAPSDEALRRDAELIKELGFNGVRIHQKVEDPRFLYWCDRLGLMVWGEMADAYAFSERAVEQLTREWLDVVRRDHSHPSIVTWVPLNESWGVPNLPRDPGQRAYVRALYQLTKALDPTRPVIGNDGWEHVVTDIWGIHDYALDGASLRERYGTPEALDRTLRLVQPGHHALSLDGLLHHDEPVIITECGGISLAPTPGEPWFGYGTVSTTEDYLALYDEIISAITDSSVLAGFCYTQFSDTEQETNGLVTADRRPKLDVEAVRRSTRQVSRVIPGDLISATQAVRERASAAASDGEAP